MKKILIALVLMAVAFGAGDSRAQSLTGCAFGSIQTFDGFENTNFGGRVGFITTFDKSREMYLRMVASSINVGNEEMKAIQPVLMMKWFVGKKWDIWWTIGGDIYFDGPNSGMDGITGLGLSRVITTVNKDWPVPATLYGFFEVSFTDASGNPTGSYSQINIGFAFSPGSAK